MSEERNFAINLAVKFNSMRYGNDLALLKSALKAAPANFKEFPELLAAAADDANVSAANADGFPWWCLMVNCKKEGESPPLFFVKVQKYR